MTSKDFLIAMENMVVCAIVGTPFGVWQESAAAGFFMTLLLYAVTPRT